MTNISSNSVLMESVAMIALTPTRQQSAKNEAGFKMNSFTMRIALAIFISFPNAIFADVSADHKKAKTLRAMGQFALALEIITPIAEGGHIDGQLMMSEMYFLGQGIRKNDNAALYWACRASESGAIRAHIFRIKLSLKAASENYQPPSCEEIKKEY